MEPLFELSGLSFSYPGSGEKALDGITLTVGRGEFLVLCGPSGSGKSTLLRHLKPSLAPFGEREGAISFEGRPLEELDRREESKKIGFVFQSPEDQPVSGKVWQELAFGLENLGMEPEAMRRRVAETVSFFGMESWFYQDVSRLSGGQKQLLNLAAVTAAQPDVLLLDEPTAQLDPIAASDFLSALGRLNREWGVTVILSEQRLEEALPMASAAVVLESGKKLCSGPPRQVGEQLRISQHSMFLSMPVSMRVWAQSGSDAPCPLTVREGQEWLTAFAEKRPPLIQPEKPERLCRGEPVLKAEHLWFRYEKNGPDVVKDFSLALKRGEFLALLGGNGTGKTTVLKLLSGLCGPLRGKVRAGGRVSLLPQDPRALFLKDTLREDLLDGIEGEGCREELDRVVSLCRLEALLGRNPYDLSGGERQRAALAKVLLAKPDILLLDEPTKGLDAGFKQALGEILGELLSRGCSVLMASHDMEFCASFAHRCALFFDGSIAAQGSPEEFFSGGSFYTTAANRMARDLLPKAVTPEDICAAWGEALQPPEGPSPFSPSGKGQPETEQVEAKRPKSMRPQTEQPTTDRLDADPPGPGDSGHIELPAAGARKISRRALLSWGAALLLIFLTLLLGKHFQSGRSYYAVALLILLEGMFPFFLAFEGRKPKPRELVTVAVLCALGTAGRAVFFFLPQFKPVMAVAVLAGAAFGGETGFLVGAVSMLASNMFYGQGPWTPWQMFAMGLTGLFGGALFGKDRLPRNRWLLGIYGFLAAILLYGPVMNLSSALTWSGELSLGVILAYFASGFPFDCMHGGAAFLFLWLAGKPMLTKLEKLKIKYGL